MSTPQMPYGFVAMSNWGDGTARAKYAVGDVVYVDSRCSAVLAKRCEAGLHRVEACFSIGEDASFYYRLAAAEIVGAKGALSIKTNWNSVSGRLHTIPGGPDYTAGWLLLYSAETA